ncbi:MAG: MerR family transcriptional regulator [Bacillota bacterium]
MADTKHIYPMSVVRRLTALSCRQIRYYERCGLIAPARSKANHRMFSQEDIDLLMEIRDRLNDGWLLQAIKGALASQKEHGRANPLAHLK